MFEHLKPGDKVRVNAPFNNVYPGEVLRVTPKKLFVNVVPPRSGSHVLPGGLAIEGGQDMSVIRVFRRDTGRAVQKDSAYWLL